VTFKNEAYVTFVRKVPTPPGSSVNLLARHFRQSARDAHRVLGVQVTPRRLTTRDSA
jgi:hypothetical protein